MKSASSKVLLGLLAVLCLFQGCKPPQTNKATTIKIGVILPLTGNLAFIGEGIRNGVLMAQEDLKGKTRWNYEFIFEDDQLSNPKSVLAFSKLVQTDKVDAVISSFSGAAHALAPLAESSRVPHIAITNDLQVTEKRAFTFINWVQPIEVAQVLHNELALRKFKKLAILQANLRGEQVIVDAIEAEAPKRGVSIVFKEVFNPGERDFRTSIAKLKAAAPEIILLQLLTPELELCARQLKEAGVTIPVTTADCFNFTPNKELFEGQWFVSTNDTAFEKLYRQRFQKPLAPGAPYAHDAAKLLIQAFETAQASGKPSPTAAAQALGSIKSYPGAVGLLTVNERHAVESYAILKEIKNGHPEVITAWQHSQKN